MEGLEIGVAMGDNNTSASAVENTNLYAVYTMGSMKLGIQANEQDAEAANAGTDFVAYGVSYAVSDDLSISYNYSEVDYENTALSTQEAQGISVSWTNGSATIAASTHQVDAAAGNAANDRAGTEVNLTFAF